MRSAQADWRRHFRFDDLARRFEASPDAESRPAGHVGPCAPKCPNLSIYKAPLMRLKVPHPGTASRTATGQPPWREGGQRCAVHVHRVSLPCGPALFASQPRTPRTPLWPSESVDRPAPMSSVSKSLTLSGTTFPIRAVTVARVSASAEGAGRATSSSRPMSTW